MPCTLRARHVLVNPLDSHRGQALLATIVAATLLVCGISISPCDAYVPGNATNRDWEEVMDVVAGNPLSFDLLPKELHPELAALADRWHRMSGYQPDPSEIDRFWKKYGPNGQTLTDDNVRAITAALRRSKFISDNAASIEKVRKAAGENLYKRIAAQGDIDPKKSVCFVAVPFPCPSHEIYTKAISFVDAACAQAKGKDVQIVLVRSPYGQKDLLKRSEARNWWWAEISELPTRYADPIRSGILKISDSFPSDTSTPWGFVFRDGHLVAEGNLADWQDNPQRVLKEFKQPEKK